MQRHDKKIHFLFFQIWFRLQASADVMNLADDVKVRKKNVASDNFTEGLLDADLWMLLERNDFKRLHTFLYVYNSEEGVLS